jgi:hypothetical protein
MTEATITDIADARRVWCVLRWDFLEGYWFIGPFPTPDKAADWDNVEDDPCWGVPGRIDPTKPLELRAPAQLPPLTDAELSADQRWWRAERIRRDGPMEQWNWSEPPTERHRCYVLQSTAEVPHLVGPFDSQLAAYVWGDDTEERARTKVDANGVRIADNETAGWQLIWLEDAGARPQLRPPSDPDLVKAITQDNVPESGPDGSPAAVA